VAGYGLNLAIRLGSNLVMARLLAPEMFGVMAIANVIMVGLFMFSDLGLRQNIVQSRRGNDPVFLDTAWIVQIFRGAALWLLAICIALLVVLSNHLGLVPRDSVYADQSLPYVIAILSFTTIIAGFYSTKLMVANRNLALRQITLVELGAQMVGLLCMLVWAWVDRSIWALVAGNIFASLALALFSHGLLPGTPNRWRWDRPAFLEIMHFGKWIFTSSILGFLVTNGDRLLLGVLVGSATLGLYVIAFLFVGAIDQLIGRVVAGVTLPAVSEVVRRAGDLRAAYYRFHLLIAAPAYFCAGLLMVSGGLFIGWLYDPRYADAGWMLQILAAILIAAPFQIAVQSYLALSMPQLHSKILFVRLIVLVAAMPVGFLLFGLPGVLWAVVVSQLSSVPIFIFYNVRIGLFDLRKELLPLPALLLGMGMGGLITSAG
jgi:O-antigen/teichoic acid export membrane protein